MRNIVKGFIGLFIIFFLLSCTVMGADIVVNVEGINRSINTEIIEERVFASADDMVQFGLKSELIDDKVILKNNVVEFLFTVDSNQVEVNGLTFTLPSEVYQRGDSIYIPLRFVLETLNYKISWSAGQKRIIADKQDEPHFPLFIIDGKNRYIVKGEAESIVSMSPGVTEKLFALGVGDRIKGRTLYCNYPAEVNEIPSIGTLYEPDLEIIINISPDIVIAETHFKQQVLDKLQGAGINSVAKSSACSMDEVYDYMLNLGAIVGKNYETRALVSSLKAKVYRVKYLLREIPESKKPTVYYVVGTGQYGEYTAGGNTFISDLLSIAGAINVADDVEDWNYSLERLISHDPDYIIGEEFNLNIMLNGDSYQVLSALQKGNYLSVNDDIFSCAAPRAVDEGLKVLIELFYPDKVNELNF